MRLLLVSIACLMVSSGSSLAADAAAASFDDGRFSFSGSIGLMNIDAKEYVYEGSHKVSQLNWESKGVVLYTGTALAELTPDWSVKATIDIGTNGDGHMVDYDWIAPNYVNTGMDGWSDRSISPDTRLAHYFAGSIEIGRRLYSDEQKSFGINAGFKYSDVKWDAYGGSYIYSALTPRDTIGEFDDGERVISYRQKIPVIFAGIDGATSFDRFTLSGGAKGGFTFGINDIDDHWLRSLRFYDDMDAAPVVMLNVEAAYHLTDAASLFVAGSYEKVFRKRGEMSVTETTSGLKDGSKDAAGASYQTMAVRVGLKASF